MTMAGLALASRVNQPAIAPRASASAPQTSIGFLGFILLHAILFIRPGDMFMGLSGMPLYMVALLGCTALVLPAFLRDLRPASLAQQPITVCILGILVAAVLSYLVHGNFGGAYQAGRDALTFVIYYLVLVGVVDTPRRLRLLVIWVVFFIMVVCVLGLLIYHGYVHVQAEAGTGIQAQAVMEGQEDILGEEAGEVIVLARLCSIGVYNNPNDVSRILVVGILLSLYCIGDRRSGPMRFLWVVPAALFGYAMQLTYSRGGFLALLTGILTLIMVRFGRVRSLILAAVLLPVLFALFAGRTTSIDTSTGTAQQRILIWRDALANMRGSPIFGIGVGQVAEAVGISAHNSFVESFVEMGMLGGTCFASACYLGFWGPYRLRRYLDQVPDSELRRLRPYLMAIVAGSIVGMFSSGRAYRIDTYMLLGLVTAYLSCIGQVVPASVLKLNLRLVCRLVLVGILCLVTFDVYVRLAAR